MKNWKNTQPVRKGGSMKEGSMCIEEWFASVLSLHTQIEVYDIALLMVVTIHMIQYFTE
jgi:hypothetical protein